MILPYSPTSSSLLLFQKGKGEGIKNVREQKGWEEVEESKGLKALFQTTEISRVGASKFFAEAGVMIRN